MARTPCTVGLTLFLALAVTSANAMMRIPKPAGGEHRPLLEAPFELQSNPRLLSV